MQNSKREVVFPVDSVEAYQPIEVKKRKINSRDISKRLCFYLLYEGLFGIIFY